MVWLLMEALFVSATTAWEALTALNSHLIVLQMLTGMYISLTHHKEVLVILLFKEIVNTNIYRYG